MHTIRPYLASTMCFCAIWLHRNAPRRCTSITSVQSSSVILNSRLSRSTPALLTRMCRPPYSPTSAIDRRLHLVALRDVGTEPDRSTAGRGDLVGHLLRGVLLQIEHADLRSVSGEPGGHRGADPLRGSGDQRDAVVHSWHVITPSIG